MIPATGEPEAERHFWEWMVQPLRRYAQFGGRARRSEYWWFSILAVMLTIIAAMVDRAIGSNPDTGPIGIIIAFGLAIPTLAVTIRRLHDIGRSGWWEGGIMLVSILVLALQTFEMGFNLPASTPTTVLGIAWVGYAVLMLVWLFTPGTTGSNRFGPDPKADAIPSP